MNINGKNIDIDDLVDEKHMHKKYGNDIYLSDFQIEVLNKYKIDYETISSVSELIFQIEEILDDDCGDDLDDLENVSKEISEFNYYNNTNK